MKGRFFELSEVVIKIFYYLFWFIVNIYVIFLDLERDYFKSYQLIEIIYISALSFEHYIIIKNTSDKRLLDIVNMPLNLKYIVFHE